MASNRFHMGGFALGDGQMLHDRKMNAGAAFKKAANQFAVGGQPDAAKIAADCRKMADGLPRSIWMLGGIMADAQDPQSRPEFHAVSSGWLLGLVYGACQHGIGHSDKNQMIQSVQQASAHGEAMANLGHLKTWAAGTVSQQFGNLWQTLQHVGNDNQARQLARKILTVSNQFAADMK